MLEPPDDPIIRQLDAAQAALLAASTILDHCRQTYAEQRITDELEGEGTNTFGTMSG